MRTGRRNASILVIVVLLGLSVVIIVGWVSARGASDEPNRGAPHPGTVSPQVGTASPQIGTTSPQTSPVTLSGTLYFSAEDNSSGRELWKSDGTIAGTALVRDIRPGSTDSHPRGLARVGRVLYFFAKDGTHGNHLWKTDGTDAGTAPVAKINPCPQSPTLVGGILYLVAAKGSHGCELWTSDGTESGTVMVKDIRKLSGSNPNALTGVGGTLYFSAYDDEHGWALWRSDGTADGTYLVKDTQRGPAPCCTAGNHLGSLTNVGGTLYFSARGGAHGQELWKSDGTETGTVMVKDISPGRKSSAPDLDRCSRRGSLLLR